MKDIFCRIVKLGAELFPLLVFAIMFYYKGIISATFWLVYSSILAIAVNYLVNKELSWTNIISAALVAVMGSVAILSGDIRYIQMKPTIINLLLAATLAFDLWFEKGWFSRFINKKFTVPSEAVNLIAKRAIIFFLLIAVANEIIWRHYSVEFWVKFKVFGVLLATLIFTISQASLLRKYL